MTRESTLGPRDYRAKMFYEHGTWYAEIYDREGEIVKEFTMNTYHHGFTKEATIARVRAWVSAKCGRLPEITTENCDRRGTND